MGSAAYRDLFPEYSGPGMMDDTWWARYGLEELALDAGDVDSPMPAHDRLAALMRGEQVRPTLAEVVARAQARSDTDPTWRGDYR